MEVFLIKALQLMLSLSILVLLHEGGHFFFSKLFGVRVEKFYLFFDPWFHLFEFKPKNSDTTYGLGWLPLGGYCKISGMIDESFDTEQLKQPMQPYEFRSKPAWQRMLIMIGGVLVNFLLALFIYSMILFHWGDDYVATKHMTQGMKFNTEAKALGFQDHDILVGTDKGEFKTYDGDMYRDLSTATRVDIIRGGKPMSLNLPGDLDMLSMIKESPRFVEVYIPLQIDSVMKDSPASKLGLVKGDKILTVGTVGAEEDFRTTQLQLGALIGQDVSIRDQFQPGEWVGRLNVDAWDVERNGFGCFIQASTVLTVTALPYMVGDEHMTQLPATKLYVKANVPVYPTLRVTPTNGSTSPLVLKSKKSEETTYDRVLKLNPNKNWGNITLDVDMATGLVSEPDGTPYYNLDMSTDFWMLTPGLNDVNITGGVGIIAYKEAWTV